ncbi:MAG: class 3 adenylate cyclase, partial [Kiritimatiellia bacterium]
MIDTLCRLVVATLLTIVCVASAHAGSVRADPSGELLEVDAAWSVHTLDALSQDSSNAAPALDDSAWPTLVAWQMGEARSAAWAVTETWYRAEVNVPPTGPVAYGLALICRNSDVAVFVDGERRPSGCGADAEVPMTPGRSALQVKLSTGRHVVAVRTRRSVNTSVNLRRFAHWGVLHARVGPIGAVSSWSDAELSGYAGQAVVKLLFALVFCGFSGFHLLVWARRRSMRSYLWFGLSTLMAGAWQFESAMVLVEPPMAWHAGWFVVNGFMWTWMGLGCLVGFLWWYTAGRSPPLWLKIAIYGAIGMGLVRIIPGVFVVHLWLIDVERGAVVGLLMLGLSILIVGAVRGKRGAMIMLVAALPGTVFLFGQVSGLMSAIQVGPLVLPMGSLGVGMVVTGVAVVLAMRFADTLKEVDDRNDELVTVNESIRRFVPEAFLAQLGHTSIVEVKRGDQVERDMAVLFADIRGFTSISEGLSPKDSFGLVNDYLGSMEPSIRESGGFIDKFIGDAIMALFPGSSVAGPGQQAVDAALGMQLALVQFNEPRIAQGQIPLAVGVGVHVGALMLGTVGGEGRLEGTVISDAVNLAARMEGLTKNYGARLLVTDQVLADLAEPKPLHREVDVVVVKGRTGTARIWEVYAADVAQLQEQKQATEEDLKVVLAAFRSQDWEVSLAALTTMER